MFAGWMHSCGIALTSRKPDAFPRPATRVGVPIQDLFYRFGFVGRRFTKYSFYCSWNIFESEGAIQEGGHRHLVGCIQGYSLCSSRFDCFVGQT